MYRLQVPDGSVASKTDMLVPYGPAGAGPGNTPAPRLVGRNVPDTMGVDMAGPSSSNVIVAFTASVPPPMRDIRMTLWPCGPTSSMLRSPGYVWPRPVSVSVTSVRPGELVGTTIVDGYGPALPDVPLAGSVIADVLAWVTVPTEASAVPLAVAYPPTRTGCSTPTV